MLTFSGLKLCSPKRGEQSTEFLFKRNQYIKEAASIQFSEGFSIIMRIC